MLFNSLHFALFFPVAAVGCWRLGPRARSAWLLGCSFYFYAAYRVSYLPILGGLILVDYAAARAMSRLDGKGKKALLALSIAGNLGALALFKYADFLGGAAADVLAACGSRWRPSPLGWMLPLGLSFHTFQSLGYVIEVYRGREPEKDLERYAAFVMFFPQLVAGPIERADGLLESLRRGPDLRFERASRGLQLMAWGFFQKMAIADRLSAYVNAVYADPASYSGTALAIATVFFSFQIYCDFCGYSNVAIGAAQVLGYELAPNFEAPYFASSPSEFWRRWHISLSSWFRDYLFIPLGGSRESAARTAFNIMVVFVLSGLWHGASWTFVVWGFLHGVGVCLDKGGSGLGVPRPPRWLAVPATFSATTVAWIFFRAANLGDAFLILFRIARGAGPAGLDAALREFNLPGSEFVVALALIATLLAVDAIRANFGGLRTRIAGWPWPARWSFYYAACAMLLLLARFDEKAFIYFQF